MSLEHQHPCLTDLYLSPQFKGLDLCGPVAIDQISISQSSPDLASLLYPHFVLQVNSLVFFLPPHIHYAIFTNDALALSKGPTAEKHWTRSWLSWQTRNVNTYSYANLKEIRQLWLPNWPIKSSQNIPSHPPMDHIGWTVRIQGTGAKQLGSDFLA